MLLDLLSSLFFWLLLFFLESLFRFLQRPEERQEKGEGREERKGNKSHERRERGEYTHTRAEGEGVENY